MFAQTAKESSHVVQPPAGALHGEHPFDGHDPGLAGERAAALPGKSLVVLDPALGLTIDVIPCEDGHTQERALLGDVLETVQPKDLWIEDRNFCTLGFLLGVVTERRGSVLVREHKNLPWK